MDSLTNSITQQTTATCVTTNMYTNTYGTTTNDYWISDRTNIWTNPYQLDQHECYIIDGQIISQKTIEKDNNKMNNNFNFGAYQGNNLRMSLYGTAVKNNAGKWVYELFTGDSTRVNCAKIAYYLNTDDKKIESNTCQRAKFYSNTCLFDHGNEFVIKKKMFSNNHKVIIAQDGDMKSIIF